MIVPTEANSHQRVLRLNWGKLCIIYEYYNIWVLQLKSKKWFTSILFLQILTKPCRTPLITEHLSLNVSWFSYARAQKKFNFLWKNWLGKNTKNFIVNNNNNKIIRVWYLQQALGEDTYLPIKTGIFPIKIVRNQDVFALKK